LNRGPGPRLRDIRRPRKARLYPGTSLECASSPGCGAEKRLIHHAGTL